MSEPPIVVHPNGKVGISEEVSNWDKMFNNLGRQTKIENMVKRSNRIREIEGDNLAYKTSRENEKALNDRLKEAHDKLTEMADLGDDGIARRAMNRDVTLIPMIADTHILKDLPEEMEVPDDSDIFPIGNDIIEVKPHPYPEMVVTDLHPEGELENHLEVLGKVKYGLVAHENEGKYVNYFDESDAKAADGLYLMFNELMMLESKKDRGYKVIILNMSAFEDKRAIVVVEDNTPNREDSLAPYSVKVEVDLVSSTCKIVPSILPNKIERIDCRLRDIVSCVDLMFEPYYDNDE